MAAGLILSSRAGVLRARLRARHWARRRLRGDRGGYAWLGNSMALVADAGHNLSDVLGPAVAWNASVLAKRRSSARFTYGLRGSSILAALFNAMFLLIATGDIVVEALRRLAEPAPVAGTTVMVVAAIGTFSTALPPGCSPRDETATSTSAGPICT